MWPMHCVSKICYSNDQIRVLGTANDLSYTQSLSYENMYKNKALGADKV